MSNDDKHNDRFSQSTNEDQEKNDDFLGDQISPNDTVDKESAGLRKGNAKIPKFLVITYIALAVWAFGYGAIAVPLNQTAEIAADGETIFQQSCLGCHAITDESRAGPGLANVSEQYSEEELQKILVNGIGEMPSLPSLGLNTEQIKAVKEYIETL